MVPVEYYKMVIDFADTMGFSLSNTAKKEIEKYMSSEESFLTARVNEPPQDEVSDLDRLRKSLISSGAIIEDLNDDA